jgi:hypothetical protein
MAGDDYQMKQEHPQATSPVRYQAQTPTTVKPPNVPDFPVVVLGE